MPGVLPAFEKASQSLPPAGGKSSLVRFLRRRVRRKKHFSVCKPFLNSTEAARMGGFGAIYDMSKVLCMAQSSYISMSFSR
jgi:hypothetical protein